MTLEQLNEHYNLVKKLERATEILRSFQSTAGLGAQNLDGMPHGTTVGRPTERLGMRLEYQERRVKSIEQEVLNSEIAVMNFLDSIEDDYISAMLFYRFIYGLSWGEVAAEVGGGNTEASVKSACYRFLSEVATA